jgi:hypothetical protein
LSSLSPWPAAAGASRSASMPSAGGQSW